MLICEPIEVDGNTNQLGVLIFGEEIIPATPFDEAIKAVREGMELTLKLFGDTLKRHQLEAIDPHGAPFNAEHHQAMAMQESTSVEPNSVLKVFQKGYMLNGRLLRPAMVVVSKAPVEAPPSIDEQA